MTHHQVLGNAEYLPERDFHGTASTRGCGCCSKPIRDIEDLETAIENTKEMLEEAKKILSAKKEASE